MSIMIQLVGGPLCGKSSPVNAFPPDNYILSPDKKVYMYYTLFKALQQKESK